MQLKNSQLVGEYFPMGMTSVSDGCNDYDGPSSSPCPWNCDTETGNDTRREIIDVLPAFFLYCYSL